MSRLGIRAQVNDYLGAQVGVPVFSDIGLS